MDPVVKQAWIDALRDGNSLQGTAKLTYIDQYDGREKNCCLGVLCKLAVLAGVIPPGVKGYDTAYPYAVAYEGSTHYLPDSVANWAGLPIYQQANYGFDLNPQHFLGTKNDEGKTFEEIAQIITERL